MVADKLTVRRMNQQQQPLPLAAEAGEAKAAAAASAGLGGRPSVRPRSSARVSVLRPGLQAWFLLALFYTTGGGG